MKIENDKLSTLITALTETLDVVHYYDILRHVYVNYGHYDNAYLAELELLSLPEFPYGTLDLDQDVLNYAEATALLLSQLKAMVKNTSGSQTVSDTLEEFHTNQLNARSKSFVLVPNQHDCLYELYASVSELNEEDTNPLIELMNDYNRITIAQSVPTLYAQQLIRFTNHLIISYVCDGDAVYLNPQTLALLPVIFSKSKFYALQLGQTAELSSIFNETTHPFSNQQMYYTGVSALETILNEIKVSDAGKHLS